MGFQDWPLVIFTILAQLAAGSFVILGVIAYITSKKQKEVNSYRLLERSWIYIFAIMAIALISSLTHLGTPGNSPFTILGIGTAWLSREIFFALLFTLFSGVVALVQWRKKRSRQLRNTLYLLGGLTGVALVFSMSMIYRYIETRPAWNTPWTTVLFFLTSGLLGSMAVVTVASINDSRSDDKTKRQSVWNINVIRGTAVVGLLFIALDILSYLFYVQGLFNGIPAAREAGDLLLNGYKALFYLRIIFVLIGALLGGLFLYRLNEKHQSQKKIPVSLACSAFAFVLAAEVISRFLFYSINIRIGI